MVDTLDKILIGTGIVIGTTAGASVGYLFSGALSENLKYAITISSAIVGAGLFGGLGYRALRPTPSSKEENLNINVSSEPIPPQEIEHVEETTTRQVHNKRPLL